MALNPLFMAPKTTSQSGAPFRNLSFSSTPPTIYFIGGTTTTMVANTNWDNTANWYNDEAGTSPAGRLPTSTEYVSIKNNCVWKSGGAPYPTVGRLTCNGDLSIPITASLTSTFTGGSVYGNFTGNCVFRNSTQLRATVNGDATFRDTSGSIDGSVSGNAIFMNQSSAGYDCTVGATTYCYDSSTVNASAGSVFGYDGSTFGGGATTGQFFDTSYNNGSFTGTTQYSDYSTNGGYLDGAAIFRDYSVHTNVCNGSGPYPFPPLYPNDYGGAWFFNYSTSLGGTLNGNAYFRGNSVLNGGDIYADLYFYDSSSAYLANSFVNGSVYWYSNGILVQ